LQIVLRPCSQVSNNCSVLILTFNHMPEKLQTGLLAKNRKRPPPVINTDSNRIDKEFLNVDVNSLQAIEPRSIGPEYVCHNIWNELKLNDALLSNGVSHKVLPMLEALVVGRLVSPGSESQTWDWIENRSSIFEITETPFRGSLSSLYRAGDTLFQNKDALETHLSIHEKNLFSLPESICFFDLTNTYFEGQAKNNKKAAHGRSKEKRSDCKLMTLALIIDEMGFPKYSRLYPGNQYEGHTLKEMLESLISMRPDLAKDRTVIMDAGIATAVNIEYLKENQFHYIVVHRGKTIFQPSDTELMEVIRKDNDYKIEVKRKQENSEVFLLCKSTGRQGKESGIRSRQENLFVERLSYYLNGLHKKGRTKSYPKIIEMIGRLREKYPKASNLYDVEVLPDDKAKNAIDIKWKKRDIYDAKSKFEGCYTLRTDRLDLSDKELWETYVMLTRVERAFRSLKSSLGLRPNFHQNEHRADAHMFISVLAYHILNIIEFKLRKTGDHRSWDTRKSALSTHQRLTIEYDVKKDDKIYHNHLRLCSSAEPEHQKIYQRLGVSDIPLPRKKYTANQ
jgi:transposase